MTVSYYKKIKILDIQLPRVNQKFLCLHIVYVITSLLIFVGYPYLSIRHINVDCVYRSDVLYQRQNNTLENISN